MSIETTLTPPPKRAVLIVNTKSRRGQEWFEDAKAALTARGIELEAAHSFKSLGQLLGETQASIKRGAPMIIAGGGDGTFSAIARYFVKSQTTLGVLPLGTGNAFARDLGIEADVETACDVIANGKVSGVDLGIAHKDYFVNVATIGLTTRIAKTLTVPMKRRFGRFVYAIAIMKALQKVKPFQVEIETENGVDSFETLQVVIGNGRYHAGPFPLSPHASIVDGRLSLYALETTNKAAFVKLAAFMTTGQHVNLPEVHYQDAIGGEIRTFPPMAVTVDGEVCAHTPFRFAVAPQAIRVVTPMGFPEEL